MYYPGQIVFDLDKKVPVKIGDDIWSVESYPKRHIHFIKATGAMERGEQQYNVATPKTLLEAEDLLAKGIIVPAPCSPTHCWKCGNWKSNCASFKKCSEWDKHS